MRKYDYSFLRDDKLPLQYLNIITSIYTLNANDSFRHLKHETIYSELENVARAQSVKGSNAIEGIVTTDERIKAIVNMNSAPLNHDEKEIVGYRDALNYVHNNYKKIQFNEDTILTLHKIMLGDVEPSHAGKYKEQDNVIMEIRNDGSRHIRFKPTPAKDVEEEMNQMILAYLDAAHDYNINQLLLIPCVILDFLCIHPFSDGNGRISRLLTLLLLYKAGFDAGKYISFEQQINLNKGMYYENLRKSSINWENNENDYFPFIGNFLITLFKCYKELDKRFATVNSKKINKTSRIEATIYNSLTPISKKEISEILPDISISTIEKVLNDLLKENKIVRYGSKINSTYFKK